MKTLRFALSWAISALAATVASFALAKTVPDAVGPEVPNETANRLLGDPIDSVATAKALVVLFTVSNAAIPASSSCQGFWHYRPAGPKEKSTVADMLAMLLANQHAGKNVIQGNCHSGQCAVAILHDNGEDLSSAHIVFNTVRGKARISSLECVITP